LVKKGDTERKEKLKKGGGRKGKLKNCFRKSSSWFLAIRGKSLCYEEGAVWGKKKKLQLGK